MIINIVLLFLVFGAAKKGMNPFVSASILCALKTLIYYVFSHNVMLAVLNGAIYAVFVLGFIVCLQRIDKKEPPTTTYSTPGGKSGSVGFVWEYVPLFCFLLLMIFGEMIAQLFTTGGTPIG